MTTIGYVEVEVQIVRTLAKKARRSLLNKRGVMYSSMINRAKTRWWCRTHRTTKQAMSYIKFRGSPSDSYWKIYDWYTEEILNQLLIGCEISSSDTMLLSITQVSSISRALP